MRRKGRVDGNQAELVKQARAWGASWCNLSGVGDGCPDGLLGYHGVTWLVEFKVPGGSLTEDQQKFIALWRGSPVHVIRTVEGLETLLLTAVRNRRKLSG